MKKTCFIWHIIIAELNINDTPYFSLSSISDGPVVCSLVTCTAPASSSAKQFRCSSALEYQAVVLGQLVDQTNI